MMKNPTNDEIKRFYTLLQERLIDKRSNIGKKHELSFVILGVLVAMIRCYDKLSVNGLHLHMKDQYEDLCIVLKKDIKSCISRTQLTRILDSFDFESFNDLAEDYWGCNILRSWNACDGKELRGSIDGASGKKRGLSIIISSRHKGCSQSILGYYDGTKESEKEIIAKYIETASEGTKISLDALHNGQRLLSGMNNRKLFYLTQVKNNQKYLLEDLQHIAENLPPIFKTYDVEKGHGRVDQRTYRVFPVNVECLEERWSDSGMTRIIEVKRESYNCKTKKTSIEFSYYISNYSESDHELTFAIRNHWSVEVMNYIRDNNFGEDKIRSLNYGVQKSISSILTFVNCGLQRINKDNNIKALRVYMSKNPSRVNEFFAA